MLHKTAVSLAALLLAARDALAAEDGDFKLATTQTGRYIVKFSAAASSKMKRDGSGTLDSSSFYNTLGDAGHDAAPARSFDSDIFSGVSFDLADANNVTIADIQALPAVEKIWPAALYTLPVSSSAVVTSVNITSPASSSSSTSEFSTWSAHNDTNVARVQAHGYLGDGVVIGFVDSGIDYMHPALGGGFGPGFKVEGGYDLVGDAYEVGGATTPDSDPMDCLGHGTHTAGIAASMDSIIPGVAPNAKLRAYKVFGCGDGTLEDTIVAAFLMAYQDGVDVISASLGSNQGFPDTATAEVATTISNAGVFVSIAAGNSGETGPFFSSSGGNGNGQTVTVGSVQAEDWVAYTTTAHSASGESRDIVYLSSNFRQFQIDGTVGGFFPTDARNITACDWELPGAPSGDVYVIPRGTCLSQIQDSTLIGLATYVFYILGSEEFEVPTRETYRDDQPTGAGAIRAADGDWLLDQFESGYSVNFTFAIDHAAVGVPRASFLSGRINDFSSWGPTLDGRMKPEISAPGGSILSTWPVDAGSWAVYSGTSMATPYISGVAALFFGSRGGRASLGMDASRMARNRIIGSGAPIYHNDGTDNLASVAKQGAGLVDALKVIEYDTLIQPASISLNDTVHFVGTHDVEITNAGTTSITYQISHAPGQTALTKGAGDAWVSTEPPYSNEEGYVATVALSTDEITVGPGETATLTLSFTEPATVDAAYMPVYGGQIHLVGSNGEAVAVTYMGIKGDIYASDMWEVARGVPVYFSGIDGLVTEGTNYTFEDGTDMPQVYFNLLWSTREFSFDFVSRDWQPSDWVYPPVASENNWLGSFRLVPNPMTSSVVDFPINNYPRFTSGSYALPQGVLANGTKIPSGDYMILARALRTFGDASNIEDWQYKTSEWFRVTRDEVVPVSSISVGSAAPTSTAAVSAPSSVAATTTSFACPTANPTSQAITLKAYVGNATTGHNFYRNSDFLGVDLADSRASPLTSWNWAAGANANGTFRLQTSVAGSTGLSTDVFASVHTNTNSLVYMYAPPAIAGSWSYLECSMSANDSSITCASGEKHYFYICESGDGLVRHGTAVVNGCTPIKITAELVAADPRCQASASATSSAIASSTSAPPSATSSAPVCSGTADPVSVIASLQGSDTEHALYQYSDFLAVDLGNSKTDLAWTYVNSSHLQTNNGAGSTVFAGVHTNNNSLIYLYAQSRLVSPYSFLDCVETSDSSILECTSAAKEHLYVCETDSAILRSGSELLSGCTAVTFKLQRQCVPAALPSSSSFSVSSLPSSTMASVSSASVSESTLSSQVSTMSSAISSASSAVSISTSSSIYVSISSTVSSAASSSPGTASSSSASAVSSAASEAASSSVFASGSVSASSASASASSTNSATSSAASTASVSSDSSSFVSSASSASFVAPSSASLPSSTLVSSVTPSTPASSSYSTSVESATATSLASASSAASSTDSLSAFSSVVSLSSTSTLPSSPSTPSSIASSAIPSTLAVASSSTEIASSNLSIVSHSSAFPTNSSASASSVQASVTNSIGSSSAPEGYTTSTVYATSIATVTACPATVVNCPAESHTTYVTTVVIAISTIVCPVSVSATGGATAGASQPEPAPAATPITGTAASHTRPSQANTLIASLPYGTGSAFQPVDTSIRATKASTSTSAAGRTTAATKKSGSSSETVIDTTKKKAPTATPVVSTILASPSSSAKGVATVPAGSSSSATTLTPTPATATASEPSTSATSEVVTADGTIRAVVRGYLPFLLSALFLLY